MRISIVAVGLYALLPLQAADTKERADAPVLGYAYSETSRELRAILGVPGASRWSEAIPLPQGTAALRIANGHRWALASSSSETSVLSLDSLQSKRLEGAGPLDGAIFSPSGTAVAIRRGSSVSVYAGLPDAATKLSEFQSEDLLATAVSDSGEATSIREGRIVNAVNGDPLLACPGSCRIAYFPGSADLAIFESGRLIELRGGETRVIAEGLQLTEIQLFAADTTRIGLATQEKLLVLERSNGAIAAEEALTGTDRMESMRLPGSWLLSAAEDSAAWLYTKEGVRFVPAAAKGKEQ